LFVILLTLPRDLFISPFHFCCSCSLSFHYPHSFPTRRSSDLSAPSSCTSPTSSTSTRTPTPARSSPCSPPDRPSAATAGTSSPRSEEHTSELQSRENLVCRLLLEKKKSISE